VLDNGAADTLTGPPDLDWFFSLPLDVLKDLTSGERINT
jgi:hypothetical protein